MRASQVFMGLMLRTCLLMVLLPVFVAPPAAAARLLRDPPEDMAGIIPAQARRLPAFVLDALGAGVGLLVV